MAELLGAALVLVPRLAMAGFALLACMMAVAVVILATVPRSPGGSFFPGVWLVAVCGVWWSRR